MAIKFIPEDKGVIIEGRELQDKLVLDMLKCLVNKMNRVELQLEKLTGEEIDCDDGDIM
jgi:hypothetical protein